MTDPRLNDARYIDPRYSNSVLHHEEDVGRARGSIAGIAIIAVIAFGIIVGWSGNKNAAHKNLPQMAAGNVGHTIAPSATEVGSAYPPPLMPLPRRTTQ